MALVFVDGQPVVVVEGGGVVAEDDVHRAISLDALLRAVPLPAYNCSALPHLSAATMCVRARRVSRGARTRLSYESLVLCAHP